MLHHVFTIYCYLLILSSHSPLFPALNQSMARSPRGSQSCPEM